VTSFFQLLMFGVFSIHFRLENNVFMIHNILGWSVLLLTIFMTFQVIRDVKKSQINFRSLRNNHRLLILTALWILDFIFIFYDVIRIE
jgi:hypothetical protein